jgi:gliding motility-associated-like protein
MKNFIYTTLFVICASGGAVAQGTNCASATPFCSGAATYPASTGAGSAEVGPNYGCLFTQPNPAWFYMQIGTPGNVTFTITSTPPRDIDFILYGPFTSPTAPCSSGMLTAANTEDCSYAGGTAPEIADIVGGVTGEYYLMLLTNWSNQPTNVSFSQTSGSGSTSCAVLCDITGVTAVASACDTATNMYSLSGQVSFTGAPITGTLTVSNSCGGSQTFNAPFISPLVYNIPGITSNGSACNVTASFSATPGCTETVSYTAPADCTPCYASANNNGPVCEGGTLNLMSGTVINAVSYSWAGPGGFTSSMQNPVLSSATIAASGTYTVTVTTPSAICTATTSVMVNPIPLVDAGFTAAMCSGDNIMLGGNGSAGTYSWSPGATLDDSTILTPTATPTVTTTYTLTITNPIGCTASDTVSVVILNPAADAGPDIAICPGGSTMLNASGGDIFMWSPGTGLSDSTIATPVANPAVTTIYHVTVSSSSTGCSASDSVTVTVNPAVIANAGADTSICIGNNTTLGASGGINYAWTPTTSLSDSAIFNPVASPTTTTTYTVIVTDASGCVSSDSVTVTVDSLPNVSAGADVNICIGASASLNASGASTYLWSPGASLNDSTIFNPVASPTTPTTYVVTGVDTNGCVNTDTVSVNLNGLTITTSVNTVICSGDSTALTASGGLTYVWSPSASLNNDSIANPIAFPTAPTTYTVIGTAGTGCADTAFVTVGVNPLPAVNAGTSLSICSGSNANLSVSGANTYVWTPASSLNNPNIPNPIASPTTTTLYTVTGTDINGCSAQDTITVVVHPIPTANAGPNTSICLGDTATLSGSGGGTYSWTPSTGLSSTTVANPLAFPSTTTTYTVTVTGAGFCTASAQVTITVNPVPNAVAGADQSICNGGSAMLSASGGTSYFWTPSAGLSNSNISNPVANPSTTTTYIVTASNASGCTDQDTVIVNVSNALSIAPSTATAETCFDNDGSITVGSVSGGAAPYMYSLNGGPAQSSNMFSSLSQGTYVVVATDAAGCASAQSVTVGQISDVNASFTATPSSGAKPLNVNFTNTSTGANSYIWDLGNGASSLLANPSTIYGANGTYTVTLYASNGGFPCIDSAIFTIEVFEEMAYAIPNIFTPNGDNKNDMFMIQSIGVSEINGSIFNRWGKKVYEWNGDANSGWNGSTNSGTAQDGTYFYILTIKGNDGTEKEEKGYIQVLAN